MQFSSNEKALPRQRKKTHSYPVATSYYRQKKSPYSNLQGLFDFLGTAAQQHIADMTYGFSWIQAFWTYAYAVHDAMAAEYAERVVQLR